MGLEPMISRTTIWRANQLHHTHHITYRTVFCPTKYHHIKFSGLNEPGGIRTLDLRLRRPLLYPAELQTHIQKNNVIFWCKSYIIGVTGFEPATSWSQIKRSSQAEPHPVSSAAYSSVTQDIFYITNTKMSTLFLNFFKFFILHV